MRGRPREPSMGPMDALCEVKEMCRLMIQRIETIENQLLENGAQPSNPPGSSASAGVSAGVSRPSKRRIPCDDDAQVSRRKSRRLTEDIAAVQVPESDGNESSDQPANNSGSVITRGRKKLSEKGAEDLAAWPPKEKVSLLFKKVGAISTPKTGRAC
jgi:hypothetical protein